jgi:hypothetical protein
VGTKILFIWGHVKVGTTFELVQAGHDERRSSAGGTACVDGGRTGGATSLIHGTH